MLLSYAGCLFFVLQHCLTTTYYCAIMLMVGQFKTHPNIAAIVTGLQSVWLRNRHPVSARNRRFFFQMFWLVLGPIQPPIPCIWHALSLGLKRPGHEADCSTPSRARINTAYSYTFCTSLYASMACTGRISPLQDLRFSYQCGWRFTLFRM
jgi:hypothetical protein